MIQGRTKNYKKKTFRTDSQHSLNGTVTMEGNK